ncbi:hypothetical protein SAMN05216257_101316 [Meinhardsimonia xiamenensis]|jgi:hypothetical protein|uniref:Uncharacterized protein n=1 Tax=Meinhardsimonia xiamenensis TaxID=990712 RepID=A0A1G8YGA6_9RHOB|nr:hypothetical protein [Meinhardsimonia xiamenensis]PRX37295.1 hypothetical protein LV81_01072 [Meinhardsimonia xiamenensis]SDK01872.1 hypothetical protein SAMN05216257_101316 [Meinhardsimonia xiamenensis]
MAERKANPIAGLGLYGGPADRRPAPSRAERIAVVLSILWIVLAGAGLFLAGRDPMASEAALRFVGILMAIFMPVAVLWVGVAALRSAQVIREETARLEVAIEALRETYIESRKAESGKSSIERKLEEIAAAQRQTEQAIATFTSARHMAEAALADDKPAIPAAARTEDPSEEQPRLALVTPPEAAAPPVSVADFIRALNFPENAEDREGFQAMRRALRDRSTAQLVQAAQDVLTLLSHDGIYMDDLTPDRARPEIWRRFARGERGRAIAALGGIRDRSCLALTAGRMRSDTIFRDAAHHFLRKFDQVFSEFEKTASDQDIAALADTRTARAFMLLGRVAGTFD